MNDLYYSINWEACKNCFKIHAYGDGRFEIILKTASAKFLALDTVATVDTLYTLERYTVGKSTQRCTRQIRAYFAH